MTDTTYRPATLESLRGALFSLYGASRRGAAALAPHQGDPGVEATRHLLMQTQAVLTTVWAEATGLSGAEAARDLDAITG